MKKYILKSGHIITVQEHIQQHKGLGGQTLTDLLIHLKGQLMEFKLVRDILFENDYNEIEQWRNKLFIKNNPPGLTIS